jgi:hypothetical protein
VRYEGRGQGYHDVEKVGKHWCKVNAGRYVCMKVLEQKANLILS